MTVRWGVLVSGSGTNLQALLDAARASALGPAEIGVVLSNRRKAGAVERARAAGVAVEIVSHRAFEQRDAFEQAVVAALRKHRVQWLALAGFMRIVGSTLLEAFNDRVINIHPSLLPAFPGLEAQRQALTAGVRVAGCTVHSVDGGVDSGAIIAQSGVIVRQNDDVDALRGRILAREHLLLPAVVRLISSASISIAGGVVTLTKDAAAEASPN